MAHVLQSFACRAFVVYDGLCDYVIILVGIGVQNPFLSAIERNRHS